MFRVCFQVFLRNTKEEDSRIPCTHMTLDGLFLALIIKEIWCLVICMDFTRLILLESVELTDSKGKSGEVWRNSL